MARSGPFVLSRARAVFALAAAAVVALAVWRAGLVGVGPDPDSDAYGHHAIARQILVEPGDLGVHWVWLPLFHYFQAGLVALGATMNTIRFLNVAVSAATPLVLFGMIAQKRPDGGQAGAGEGAAIALFAALLAALSPIAMQMGTTAQPEPIFALLILGAAWALERKRSVVAAALLTVAVLMRYEAWAALAVTGAVALWDTWRERRLSWRVWLPVVAPAVGILIWAVLRRPYDGAWFGFLKQTREFANDALKAKSSLDAGPARLAEDVVYYAALVPWRVMGPIVLFAPLGLVRTVRVMGRWFVLLPAGCLAFLTLTWVMRGSLGLDRHFVVLVPLYATLVAHGIQVVAQGIGALVRRLASRGPRGLSASRAAAAAAAVFLAVAALTAQYEKLDVWMGHWRGALEHGYPDRIAAGGFLRELPPRSTIFCDEATLEILSGLDRRRFDRHWVDEPNTRRRVEAAALRDGEAYVATWIGKMKDLRPLGEIVYRPAGVTGEEAGLAVLRVKAGAVSERR